MTTKKALTLEQIWQEYEKGRGFKSSINLYDDVKRNEKFVIGNQWDGLEAPDLEKPVINILKRVVTYMISQIVTDDVAASITPMNVTDATTLQAKLLSTEVEKVLENNHMANENRQSLRNCIVDGDGCNYWYFDPDKEEVVVEQIDNTRIIFGNPYLNRVQKQPYIIIEQPVQLDSARELARASGCSEDVIRAIAPDFDHRDEDGNYSEQDRVTILVRLWRDTRTKTIHACRIFRDGFLQQDRDLQLELYPVSFMNWEPVRHRYHGQSVVTGLIPNHVMVNRLWAMAAYHMQNMAFPKVLYDATKITKWTNNIGEAIGVTGNPNEALFSNFRAADFSSQLFELCERTINYTRDMMGASDAALGNVRPDNTSAIIAVQQASSAPLEIQKLQFYQFCEDNVRIILELIVQYYGPREVSYTQDGEPITALIDFGAIDMRAMNVKVDIGASSYWSELIQIQTLDGLLQAGVITDAITYLEAVPDDYIKNKNKLIEKLRERAQLQPVENPRPCVKRWRGFLNK